jgi:hypothetical protein
MKANQEINKYLRKDPKAEACFTQGRSQKYNGLINIIADPIFLWACYDTIKSKAGNMSRGITSETLDGIKEK